MTEFFKKNPIALRHCLLYIFLHEESIDKLFDDFCEPVGNDLIKKEEFQFWFALFEQGIVYLDEQPVADISEFIRNDKHALRVFIMYEWLSAKRDLEKTKQFFIKNRPLPVFNRYMHFCNMIGEDVMEYQEFDFWFYRFANGDFNLNFERDKNKKIYELMDMPIDIMRNIVEYLDIIDRMSLERTSQSLRLFSQDQKLFHGHLAFDVYECVSISFEEEHQIHYEDKGNDCLMEFRGRVKILRGVSFLKQALQDFKKVLENPKLYLQTLTILYWREDSDSSGRYIENALKLTHLLHVKHLILSTYSMKTLLNVLPSLTPGYLTSIIISFYLDKATIGKLVEMDQWKQAKHFDMSNHPFIGPLRHLFHFHEFTVSCYNLSVEDAREMEEYDAPKFSRVRVVYRKSTRIVFLAFGYAFFEFRGTVGPGVIKIEELQHCFDQFEQGKFDNNKEPVSDMRDVLRNDKYALRACVLYESLKFKYPEFKENNKFIYHSVFSVYMHFCKVIGDDVMEYREFDFWFYRFANGVFDLKFEREKQEKILELMDMPIDIMRNIVEYLNIGDRLSLEKTSQSLRLFSQDQKLFHRNLTIEAGWKSANISFGRGACISYKNQENDCVIEFSKRKKVLRGVSPMKKAFQDFKKILENPRLYLHTLTISFLSWPMNIDSLEKQMEDALKFTNLLHVKHLSLRTRSMKTLLNTLPFLKPGYLTRITIDNDLDEATIGELVKMDQWRQAKYLCMGTRLFDGPLRHLSHFHKFTVAREEMLIDDVRGMKEILFDSPDFDGCTMYLYNRADKVTIMQVFGGPVEGSSDTFHYPIPNSTEYFEIIVSYFNIKIVRKKK